MSYLLYALMQLVRLSLNAAVILFLARLGAEASRADFYNPLSQLIYRATNPVLAPVRRVLPNWRTINLAALVVIWLLLLLKQSLLSVLAGFTPHPGGLLVMALASVLSFTLSFYLVVIFAWSLLSLLSNSVAPNSPGNPLRDLLAAIVMPLLRPLRGKLVFGMMDLAPAAVMVMLMLARWLLAAPLLDLGAHLAGAG